MYIFWHNIFHWFVYSLTDLYISLNFAENPAAFDIPIARI